MIQTQHNLEFESQEKIKVFNLLLLQQHIQYCYSMSTFYRHQMDALGIHPEQIQSLADLQRLPCTTKEDLERHANDFLCVSNREIVDTCLTSGTIGKPISLLQTASDLERLGYNEKISFQAAGMTDQDSVMIICALDRCFMAGMAYFEGIRQIGARAIRVGPGTPSILAQSILLHRPSIIVCVPTQAVSVAEALYSLGHQPRSLGVRMLICIGEPVRTLSLDLSLLGKRLKDFWDCDIIGTYAGTEIATSFTDCACQCGGHFHPELITVEILDSQGRPLPAGTAGEVVVTPLQVTGMPLLRYRTEDIATYYTDPCPCGRHSFRLSSIIGRMQQKMKLRGTTVYPGAIFSVLQDLPEIKNYYLEVSGQYELSESIRIVVGSDNPSLSAGMIAEKICSYIRVKPDVEIRSIAEVASRILQEDKRKAVTFFDYRVNNTMMQNQ
jgi:phenylacetate-CoA ligase